MIRHFVIPLLLTAVVTGCATQPQPRVVVDDAPLPVVSTNSDLPVRTSEVVRAYQVGAYVDPSDTRVRHDAHVIHRVEAAPAWNLQALPEAEPLPDAERIALADQQAEIRRQRKQAAALEATAQAIGKKLEAATELATKNQELVAENTRLQAELDATRQVLAEVEPKTETITPKPLEDKKSGVSWWPTSHSN